MTKQNHKTVKTLTVLGIGSMLVATLLFGFSLHCHYRLQRVPEGAKISYEMYRTLFEAFRIAMFQVVPLCGLGYLMIGIIVVYSMIKLKRENQYRT